MVLLFLLRQSTSGSPRFPSPPSSSSWFSSRPFLSGVLFLFLSLSSCCLTDAKIVTGDFKLSGEQSEYKLTTFAVMPAGGRLKVHMSSEGLYAHEMELKFRLYRDVEWPKYKKALTCQAKIQLAQQTNAVPFHFVDSDKKWEANVNILMFNDPDGTSKRPHYWYFVVDDCSLEEYFQDDKVPWIHYEITVENHLVNSKRVTHLSADEWYLVELHTVTLVLSGLVAFLLLFTIALKLSGAATSGGSSRKTSSIHASVLWVASAAALDAGSSLCELVHLQVFKSNGVGSYFMDALAAHLEAICDALLLLLLISIAAGWTLPSDIIAVNPNANSVQRLLQDLARPLGAGWSAAGVLALVVIAAHVVLAQWGRTYNDDFESYHDYSHLPGKILMGTRIVLGILFLAATVQTRLKCNVPQLDAFYLKLAVLGLIWFQSLPLLTWCCNVFVPYYLRNPAVYVGSALLQSSSIIALAWLVTTHSTTYSHYSHMAAPSDQSLTDSLNAKSMSNAAATIAAGSSAGGGGDAGSRSVFSEAARTWKLGKAKVRLD